MPGTTDTGVRTAGATWEKTGEWQNMREIRYADAGMDMKKLALCLAGKLWMVLLAALIGGALGGVIRAAVNTVPEAEREYQAMSKVYLDFAADETGEVYQAYNGYTWNDLMATDPILDVTMQYLPEHYTREEVAAAVKAEILSDLRLLTITVTTHDADSCNAILKAAGQSLVDRGEAAKEFRQIQVIQTTQASLVVADARLMQAVVLGLVTAAAAVILGLLLGYVLDDRIMVAADLRQVTDAPFIGYEGTGGRLEADCQANLAYLRQSRGETVILPLRQKETISEETWQKLGAAQGVVLSVPYGRLHGVYLDYVIEQLKLRQCTLAGVTICDADGRFLRRYYGRTE